MFRGSWGLLWAMTWARAAMAEPISQSAFSHGDSARTGGHRLVDERSGTARGPSATSVVAWTGRAQRGRSGRPAGEPAAVAAATRLSAAAGVSAKRGLRSPAASILRVAPAERGSRGRVG